MAFIGAQLQRLRLCAILDAATGRMLNVRNVAEYIRDNQLMTALSCHVDRLNLLLFAAAVAAVGLDVCTVLVDELE